MAKSKVIPVTCDPDRRLDYVALSDMVPFQDDLKTLTPENAAKLRNSIVDEGIMAPWFMWREKVLDGHQRVIVLEELLTDGYTIQGGKLPVVQIKARTAKDAARKLLKLTSAYGRPQPAGAFAFAQLHDLSFDHFKDVELPNFNADDLAALFASGDPIDDDAVPGGGTQDEPPPGPDKYIEIHATDKQFHVIKATLDEWADNGIPIHIS